MRIFVTGATGYIRINRCQRSAQVLPPVTGLVPFRLMRPRSLTRPRRKPSAVQIEDLDSLRRGAAAADSVIHTAFFHAFGQARLTTRLRVMLGGVRRISCSAS